MINIFYIEQKSGLYYTELQSEFSNNRNFNLIKNIEDADYVIFGPGFLCDESLSKNEVRDLSRISARKCLFLNKEYKNLERKLDFTRKNKIEYVFTVHQDYQIWNELCPDSKFYKIPFAFNPNIFKDYGSEKTIDVGFTGNLFNKGVYVETDIMGENFNNVRERIFNKLHNYNLSRYNQFLGAGMYLKGEEYGKKINSSKIWICTPSAIDLVGTRFYEIMGCNTLLFCKNIDNIYDNLFEDGVHYVGFNDDLSDFEEKLTYYLNNDEERKEIALRGHLLAVSNHTWQDRADSIYEVIKQ